MSLLQAITDFFESIFKSSSPDVQKKQKLKKIEVELKSLPSGIYKNGLVQPNFAEVLRILYIHTRPIYAILENTIASPDIKRNTRFEYQLIVSCYSEENQERLKSLEYENRKNEITLAEENNKQTSKIYEEQHRTLEKLVSELNSKELMKIDNIFIKLKQLIELCKFNFVTPLKTFNPKFNPNEPSSTLNFNAVPPISLENVLLDLYYIISDFKMNMSVAQAVIALAQIITDNATSEERQNELINSLKKIEYACHKILTESTLKNMIRLSKQNPDFEPKRAAFSADSRQKFAIYLQEQFSSDENRIKRELQDQYLKDELSSLFENKPILELAGYNQETCNLLIENNATPFTQLTPLKILKSFVTYYYPAELKQLLDDIVIEGFFSNPTYKSQFSQNVFNANEIQEIITSFEQSFEGHGHNSLELLKGYIRDSHKDQDFSKKLKNQVDNINAEAKQIVQTQVTSLFSLYVEIGDLLQDAKKPSCEIVSNLKVLMMSSRNRDTTDFIENNYEKWKLFFEIMKNYAIITMVDKK